MPAEITVTVTVDTDDKATAEHAAEQIAAAVEAAEITIDGVTSQTSHTVASVKHSTPSRKSAKK